MAKKETLKTEKYRSTTHMILLYPDNEEHQLIYDGIITSYDYASILHDKDLDDKGELIKPHWHIVIRFKNAMWNTAIAKELGLNLRFIERVRNFDNALLYLIHYNEPDKYQYSVDEVKGHIGRRINMLINSESKNEGEKVLELLDYLDRDEGKIRFMSFAKHCAANGYWSEFRRSGSIFIKLIEEHNLEYIEFIKSDARGIYESSKPIDVEAKNVSGKSLEELLDAKVDEIDNKLGMEDSEDYEEDFKQEINNSIQQNLMRGLKKRVKEDEKD